jgi:hypothetical protein
MRRDTTLRTFKFDTLSVSVIGLGVFFPSDRIKAQCAEMTVEHATKVNRAAWKVRRSATRAANRVNNITLHGWGPYENLTLEANVAEAVCKLTWARMQSREAA